jgi:hypothetical protein
MTTKIQHSASSFDFDTLSTEALQACTGGDGTSDAQRGYTPRTPQGAWASPRPATAPPPTTPAGSCPTGTGMSTYELDGSLDAHGAIIGGSGNGHVKVSRCEVPSRPLI